MPKSAVFPYGITLREEGAVDIFPAAELFLKTKGGEHIPLVFIIDSGATITALPLSDAPTLGINAESGVSIRISGIGGNAISGWQHKIKARLGDSLIEIPVVFLDNDNVPRVLGRAGVFEQFGIIFEEYNKRSVFLAKKSSEAKSVSKILDHL